MKIRIMDSNNPDGTPEIRELTYLNDAGENIAFELIADIACREEMDIAGIRIYWNERDETFEASSLAFDVWKSCLHLFDK